MEASIPPFCVGRPGEIQNDYSSKQNWIWLLIKKENLFRVNNSQILYSFLWNSHFSSQNKLQLWVTKPPKDKKIVLFSPLRNVSNPSLLSWLCGPRFLITHSFHLMVQGGHSCSNCYICIAARRKEEKGKKEVAGLSLQGHWPQIIYTVLLNDL